MKRPDDSPFRFRGKTPDEYPLPDLNPHMRLHYELVPPVVVAEEAPLFRGRWREAFPNPELPIHLEIGPGNGFYLSGMAARHPSLNWLGVEIRFKRVVLVAKKILGAGVSNARIARYDAWQLDDLFEPGELGGLHINFPDPWKREVNAKHRLICPELVAWSARALRPGSEVRLKSDHRPNLERFVDAAKGHPFELTDFRDDVAAVGAPWADDLVTNYQSKFIERGEPVYAAMLRRLDA